MASKSHAETASENGKPARNSSPPVIRRLEVATEDGRTRLLKRQMPAWVISGLIHFVFIAGYILISEYFLKEKEEVKANEKPIVTKVEAAEDPKEDLTNEDPGLDPELTAAVEVDKEDRVVVDAKVVDGEPSGLPNQDSEVSSVTQEAGSLIGDVGTTGINADDVGGAMKMGTGGPGGLITTGALAGRSGATREKMLKSYGGNDETERAVALGLSWIAKQQKADGHWEFDQGHQDDHIAATGMALLPFLAAGETPVSGKKYMRNVTLGLSYLLSKLGANGQYPVGNYSQAIGTIPLCEVAGMTKDKKYLDAATRACNYIVSIQDGNGSWGYAGKSPGDTSIVGWQIQALKSGRLAGIVVKDQVFKDAEKFFESVASDSGSRYGYRTPGATERMTAVGLLCRQYMGWTPKQAPLAAGVNWMWQNFKPTAGDMYYTYYASQVFHFFDGPAWHRDWNPAMQKVLLPTQNTEKTKGVKPADIGCWNADKGSIGSGCGKLGTTCLCVLTLEVFYRHLPLYKRDGAGGDKVLKLTE